MPQFPLLLLLVVLAISKISSLSGAPPPDTSQEFLDAHNRARADVGVAPLKWSRNLAKATSLLVRYQRDKQGCNFAKLTSGKYGGNQLWAGGSAVTPRAAVESWVAEKEYYDYSNNSCAGEHQCGVYTQVVWRKSAELGCAQTTCAKEGSSLTICFYDPPGEEVRISLRLIPKVEDKLRRLLVPKRRFCKTSPWGCLRADSFCPSSSSYKDKEVGAYHLYTWGFYQPYDKACFNKQSTTSIYNNRFQSGDVYFAKQPWHDS